MTVHPARRPLDLETIRRGAGNRWSSIEVVAQTGSTNADLVALAAAGDVVGHVLLAEHQSAGRGRHGRVWSSPAGAQLAMSVAVDAGGPADTGALGWLPLLAGTAASRAIAALTGVGVRLKWPNDLLIDGRKVAGILAELAHGPRSTVVIGIGINTALAPEELPVPTATSLQLHSDSPVDRSVLAAAVLTELGATLTRWPHDVAGLALDYRAQSATIGARVRVELPGDREIVGTACDVDGFGRIVVQQDGSSAAVPIAAGDVTHLRSV